jgi:hypothetical protein
VVRYDVYQLACELKAGIETSPWSGEPSIPVSAITAVVYDDDKVGIAHGPETVDDDERRAALH